MATEAAPPSNGKKRALPSPPTGVPAALNKRLAEEITCDLINLESDREQATQVYRPPPLLSPLPPSPQRLEPTPALRYVLESAGELQNKYKALRYLEESRSPPLNVRVAVPSHDTFVIQPQDELTARSLQELADSRPRGIKLEPSIPQPRRRKGILLKFPVEYDFEAHPLVVSARRCTVKSGGRRLPTRSVEILLQVDRLPDSLDLGWLGQFHVPEYVQEPTQCYRCQRYGHIARRCRQRGEQCGVCSQLHPTSQCIEALKGEGPRPEPKYANCGMNHHAWFKRCPERLRRLLTTTAAQPPHAQGPRHPLLPKEDPPSHRASSARPPHPRGTMGTSPSTTAQRMGSSRSSAVTGDPGDASHTPDQTSGGIPKTPDCPGRSPESEGEQLLSSAEEQEAHTAPQRRTRRKKTHRRAVPAPTRENAQDREQLHQLLRSFLQSLIENLVKTLPPGKTISRTLTGVIGSCNRFFMTLERVTQATDSNTE
ncbi:hypothetical protein E2C01_043440 [Portunus trituberculatus]|uniref:CCHC-type domain-containing protein n=1 Tax=Portunus trituberculatus TaxID=210409 RepID=A0A5B7FT01_PORTR|nr:hypothetical protein [Portunus trituberculatus]